MDADRVELEAKVTFLERAVELLNEAMVEQGRLTSEFERRIEWLERKLEAQKEPEVGPHDEAPPHY